MGLSVGVAVALAFGGRTSWLISAISALIVGACVGGVVYSLCCAVVFVETVGPSNTVTAFIEVTLAGLFSGKQGVTVRRAAGSVYREKRLTGGRLASFVSIGALLVLFLLPLPAVCYFTIDASPASWSHTGAGEHQPRKLVVEPHPATEEPPTKWVGRHWDSLTAEERREVLAPVRERLEEVRQARRETVERAEQLARGGDTQKAIDLLQDLTPYDASERLRQLLSDRGPGHPERRPLLPHDLRGIPSDDELAGGPPLLQLGRAAILYRAGRYAEAEQDAREVEDAASATFDPPHELFAQARLLRVLAVAAQNRLGEAEGLARSAVERHPDKVSLRMTLAVLMESGGNVDGAERQTREAERLVPAENRTVRAGLLADLCRMNLRLGNVEEAERFGRAAVEADPDSLPARLNLAAVLLGMGRTGEAEAEMVAAADAHPQDAQPAANLSGVRLEQGEPKAAEALVDGQCLNLG